MTSAHTHTHTITLRNKGDNDFINKSLPYYGNVATIFENSVATRPFANTSNEPLSHLV
jgi:hypothetical protein